tara:strand:- start:322 stop:432 length:111 start_codon:yes stop_codon:yes gene_type:complete
VFLERSDKFLTGYRKDDGNEILNDLSIAPDGTHKME